MKKIIVTSILLAMCAFCGCGEKDPYAEWEEDWAASGNGETVTDVTEDESSSQEEEADSQNVVSEIPAEYSLEEKGLITEIALTPMRQDAAAIDWASSAISAIESNLIVQGKATKQNIDLSEAHLVYYSYHHPTRYDETTTIDGKYLLINEKASQAAAFSGVFGYDQVVPKLANGVGPVSEEKVPYKGNNKEELEESVAKLMQNEMNGSVRMFMGDWLLKDANYLDVKDRDAVKRTIMEKGALQIGYFLSPPYISENQAYYYPNCLPFVSHTAVIVGWDDNYSTSNFGEQKPQNDGAWIVFDTVGSFWGTDGYIWISYEDPSIQQMISYEMCSRAEYGDILSYDGIGYNDTIKTADEEYTTIANVFKMEQKGEVKSVGVYTIDPKQTIEVTVYRNSTEGFPDSGDRMSTLEVEMPYAGYHVLDLEESVPLEAGDSFCVVVKYLNSDTTGQAPIEGPAGEDILSNTKTNNHIVSQEGQSYAFVGGEWYDLSLEENAECFDKEAVMNNACIKALLKK